MAKRQIVHIDEEKCNGCGLCVPSCTEGAIQIINGKAKLRADNLCDGLGACLGNCPLDAITIIEREADHFDEAAVEAHLKEQKKSQKTEAPFPIHMPHGSGCPGSRAKVINQGGKTAVGTLDSGDIEVKIKPQLTQWPVQLKLVPPTAPYFEGADLLVTADCVPFAYPNYHLDLLKGKKVVVGCPKLDDVDFYKEKLVQMIKFNNFKSITVAYMEVPCCTGIMKVVEKAIEESGVGITLQKIRIGIEGEAIRL